MTTTEDAKFGLRLTLGGAPNSPHAVRDVPGLFRPDQPTPVGGKGELDLDFAKALDANSAVPLELVSLAGEDVESLRAEADQAKADLANAVVTARKTADGAEAQLVRDQAKAVKKGNN